MSKYIYLMGIDPGGTTGIAVRSSNGQIYTCTASTPNELYDFIRDVKPNHVVYENFQAQTIDRHGLHTVRIVGGIEALCYILDIPMTRHMPQDRRPFLEDAKELLQGRRTVIHERDALAHVLRYEHDNDIPNRK